MTIDGSSLWMRHAATGRIANEFPAIRYLRAKAIWLKDKLSTRLFDPLNSRKKATVVLNAARKAAPALLTEAERLLAKAERVRDDHRPVGFDPTEKQTGDA